MLPFVSTDGLAGDVVVIRGIIRRRETEISSLEERVIELEDTRQEEDKTIEEDIKRRIKELEKQIKATTRERVKRLKAVDIAHSKRRVPIIQRIDELQRLNDHDRCLIAPIRKLPAELLGYVFQHHIDSDKSPWVLTLVSKSWRHTAMTTPSLWVHLVLLSTEHQRRHASSWRVEGRTWYSTGRRIVCHNASELDTIVSRAGSVPLDIHVIYRNDNVSVVQSVLGDTAISRRVASLVIETVDSFGTGPVHDVAGVTIGSFPLLHTLTILSASEKLQKEMLETISSSSPQFKHLTIHRTISFSLDFTFWPRLRSLNIHGHSTREKMNGLISHLGELETLEGCPAGWPNDSTPEVSLPKLTILGVYCIPESLCRLQLPALLRLSIEALSWNPPSNKSGEQSSTSLLSLPALEILEVRTNISPSWLAILSAPSMRVFSFREERWRHGEEISTFPNCTFSAVQDFTLHYPCTDQGAISALECVPNAEKVVLSSSSRGDPWGLKILERLADVGDVLCPNMTRFTLGSPENRVVLNKVSANARARKAIRVRVAGGGVRMDHFEIQLKARCENVQYA